MLLHSGSFFAYKKGHERHKVRIEKIVYIESCLRKMVMYLADGRQDEFYGKFKDVYHGNLQKHGFIQNHRSYVVNSRYIKKIAHCELHLLNGTTLPIGLTRKREMKQMFPRR